MISMWTVATLHLLLIFLIEIVANYVLTVAGKASSAEMEIVVFDLFSLKEFDVLICHADQNYQLVPLLLLPIDVRLLMLIELWLFLLQFGHGA
ncbi:hypothetical protein TRFO_00951 [Tritrichomonas foetus]|uniref:Uncharacterized protein n=1 Tax=Tritrichomonas foetus TaxID=1144522 RepID=A0A1J4L6M4_9EUKA|nr:hypothetical protein TRFO_00951 [Tritrichomonas foetus]|eukprot:OHT17660.1 hypothetical protein TRFO_00951 [Tritrichomonas foetus]